MPSRTGQLDEIGITSRQRPELRRRSMGRGCAHAPGPARREHPSVPGEWRPGESIRAIALCDPAADVQAVVALVGRDPELFEVVRAEDAVVTLGNRTDELVDRIHARGDEK